MTLKLFNGDPRKRGFAVERKRMKDKINQILNILNDKIYGSIIIETANIPYHLQLTIYYNITFTMLIPFYKLQTCSVNTIVNAIIDEYEAHIIDNYFIGGISHPRKEKNVLQ